MVDAATEAAAYAECDVETEVERLFRGYRLPRTAPAVEVAAAALRARGLEPSYIATGGGSDANVFDLRRPAGGERGQRHRAQPPARRERDRGGARADARRDARDSRGRRRVDGAVAGSSASTREVAWEGKLATVRVDRFRYEDGEEAEREIVAHPGAVADPRARRRPAAARAPAARGGGRGRRCSSFRPASSTRARTRWPPPSASWPRRSARARAPGGRSSASTPHPGSRTRSATSTWPRTSTTSRPRPRENERIEIEALPLTGSRRRDRRVPRLEDAHRAALAADLPALTRSCSGR